MQRRWNKIEWRERSPGVYQLADFGEVQRAGGRYYAHPTGQARQGPWKKPNRAFEVVERHAAVLATERAADEESAARRARQLATSPKRRKRKRPIAQVASTPDELKCTACGVKLRDGEPFTYEGDFPHPRNGCRNQGLIFDRFPPTKSGPNGQRWRSASRRVRGIQPVQPSRFSRAKARGARLATKHRPRA